MSNVICVTTIVLFSADPLKIEHLTFRYTRTDTDEKVDIHLAESAKC